MAIVAERHRVYFIVGLRSAFFHYGRTTRPLPGPNDGPAPRHDKGHASAIANVVWRCPCHVPCYVAGGSRRNDVASRTIKKTTDPGGSLGPRVFFHHRLTRRTPRIDIFFTFCCSFVADIISPFLRPESTRSRSVCGQTPPGLTQIPTTSSILLLTLAVCGRYSEFWSEDRALQK